MAATKIKFNVWFSDDKTITSNTSCRPVRLTHQKGSHIKPVRFNAGISSPVVLRATKQLLALHCSHLSCKVWENECRSSRYHGKLLSFSCRFFLNRNFPKQFYQNPAANTSFIAELSFAVPVMKLPTVKKEFIIKISFRALFLPRKQSVGYFLFKLSSERQHGCSLCQCWEALLNCIQTPTWSWSTSASPVMTILFSIRVSEMPPFTVCHKGKTAVSWEAKRHSSALGLPA